MGWGGWGYAGVMGVIGPAGADRMNGRDFVGPSRLTFVDSQLK